MRSLGEGMCVHYGGVWHGRTRHACAKHANAPAPPPPHRFSQDKEAGKEEVDDSVDGHCGCVGEGEVCLCVGRGVSGGWGWCVCVGGGGGSVGVGVSGSGRARRVACSEAFGEGGCCRTNKYTGVYIVLHGT
jgi:hypothetical protein